MADYMAADDPMWILTCIILDYWASWASPRRRQEPAPEVCCPDRDDEAWAEIERLQTEGFGDDGYPRSAVEESIALARRYARPRVTLFSRVGTWEALRSMSEPEREALLRE